MLHQVSSRVGAGWLFFLAVLFAFAPCALAQSTDVRIMSANLNGNAQTYQPFALRIFQGLKPDVVAIQEFNYNGSSPADIRSMVDTAFGTNFVYFRETNSGYSIPNGVISRYPIVNSGSWPDAEQSQPNRGFAWAQIDLPGTNDLYIVSVHLLTSSATARGNEAAALKNLIQANFPAGAWVVVAGDFNTDSRTESAMVTFDSFLSDNPIPADNNGDADTSQNRNHPHDYVLPSFAFTNVETASVFPSHSFPNGLVFDSTVYTPLSDVSPVQFGDSTNAQHMAVIKDFLVSGADSSSTNPPSLSAQPLDRGVSVGSNVLFSVTASGATPLSFQWYFNTNTVLAGATNSALTVTNAQLTNAGTYSVIVTNNFGGITSSIATLIVTNAAPVITTQPQNQFATPGGSATFSVAANGTAPIGYQWFFNTNTAIAGAITNFITITNAQFTNAGAYSVLVTNSVGSVTSAVATLTISVQSSSATNIVISQIYGGGGNASATYKNDFVELFNPTASAISVSGWSVQYAGATGTSWQAANLSGTIEPYHYYLVQLASGGTAGNPLPLPDSTGGMNISASNGKLALVASTTALTGSNPLGTSSIIDFVGFGTGNAYEGSAAATGAPASNNTTAILRKNGGFADSNDNTNDFTTVSPPAPRDSATPPNNPSVSPAAAALGRPSFGTNSFSFTVVGTAGSNYVIQVASNLSGGNWVSVFTNAAPFTFTDSNASAFPQEFYRAVASP
jgi:endonuclease/exonuclease/phosphatase family metal-dependent hydrolase